MLNALRLYGRYLGISLRGQMQYRASFIMVALGSFLNHFTVFFGVYALFDRFANLQGWTLAEIALFYGMVNISFAISDAASRGFDLFAGTIKAGEFDRLLLRPRSTALQLAGQEFTIHRIGRLSQGLAILLWAAYSLELSWTAAKIGTLLFAIAGGAGLFYGLIVIQATLAFWTTEGLEVMNTVTYGGTEAGQYPLSIYRPWFRRFFTFVVPLACISYYPALAILERPDPLGAPLWFQYLAPGIGILFLLLCLQLWKIGVRHYRSTGS